MERCEWPFSPAFIAAADVWAKACAVVEDACGVLGSRQPALAGAAYIAADTVTALKASRVFMMVLLVGIPWC
jgi:hypothetical protein